LGGKETSVISENKYGATRELEEEEESVRKWQINRTQTTKGSKTNNIFQT
jgi:hypothetical protein